MMKVNQINEVRNSSSNLGQIVAGTKQLLNTKIPPQPNQLNYQANTPNSADYHQQQGISSAHNRHMPRCNNEQRMFNCENREHMICVLKTRIIFGNRSWSNAEMRQLDKAFGFKVSKSKVIDTKVFFL